jgi:transposase
MVSMRLNAFEVIVKSESKAKLYLRQFCWRKGHVFCSACHSYKTYRIRGKTYRCQRCGYTFHDFSNRWLNHLKISPKTWLWILKLFELEVSARKIAQQLEISYPTALKAVNMIRTSIVAHTEEAEELLKGEIELDETYFGGKRKGKRGRGAYNKVPVFGILERNGVVKVSVVHDVTAESLLGMTVKMVRRGSIVYTDKFRSYDALMFCGYRHLRIDHGKRFSRGKVYINGLEGFWSYAKERLAKFHGVSKEKFPLYLKEMEFRYNNRRENIFNMLAQNLCSLVPNRL